MILPDRLLHVFHWPGGHPIRVLLPAMILLSLVLHAAGLYVFRAKVPARTGALPPLPASLTVLPGGTVGPAGAKSILLAARDPSWMHPGRYRDRLLPAPRSGRVVAGATDPPLPPLLDPPAPQPSRAWLPSLPPIASRPLLGDELRPPAAPSLAPLTARFDPPGPAVPDALLQLLRDATPAPPPGEPLELLLRLDAAGEARHAWLLGSSGVPAFDLAAQRAVLRSRFGPAGGDYQGVLRIIFGGAQPDPAP
jgi:hypothetical protein